MRPDRDLVEAFLAEGRELVMRATAEAAAVRQDPGDAGALEALFRTVHTLKGSSALMDLGALSTLQHEVETALERASRREADGAADIGHVIAMLDLTEAWIDSLEEGGEAPDVLLQRTARLAATLAGSQSLRGPERDAGEASRQAPTWAVALLAQTSEAGPFIALRYRPSPECYFRGEDPLAVVRAIPGLCVVAADLAPPPSPEGPYDTFKCRLEFQVLSRAAESDIRAAVRLVADEVELAPLAARASAATQTAAATLRVSGGQLDNLAARVDELVIAKNALNHLLADLAGLPAPLARELHARRASMDRAVAAVHDAAADLRLVSLRGLFGRFPRHVREVAASVGKSIDFSVWGEEVVLDKSVAEQLFEPLLHLLRNAVDHGIEAADVRRSRGKPEVAKVTLSARIAGDTVILEVEDDGGGIDTEAVRRAAVAGGLLDAQAAALADDETAARMIFLAGFSTAGKVGALSGRGVGMDAVRETVERLGGRAEIRNRPGQGLAVALVLPARTVLSRVLVVEAGGQRFGVPLQSVTETHRVRAEEITPIRQGRAFVRRDTVIPILRLRSLLGLADGVDAEAFPVLTLSGQEEPLGVQVDALGAQIEAPLRPMDGLLKAYPGLMGSILEGDGRVLLVLDLAELAA